MISAQADPVKQQVAAHWNRRAAHFDEDFGHSIRTPADRAPSARILALILPAAGAVYAATVAGLPGVGGCPREAIEPLVAQPRPVSGAGAAFAGVVGGEERRLEEGVHERQHRGAWAGGVVVEGWRRVIRSGGLAMP